MASLQFRYYNVYLLNNNFKTLRHKKTLTGNTLFPPCVYIALFENNALLRNLENGKELLLLLLYSRCRIAELT